MLLFDLSPNDSCACRLPASLILGLACPFPSSPLSVAAIIARDDTNARLDSIGTASTHFQEDRDRPLISGFNEFTHQNRGKFVASMADTGIARTVCGEDCLGSGRAPQHCRTSSARCQVTLAPRQHGRHVEEKRRQRPPSQPVLFTSRPQLDPRASCTAHTTADRAIFPASSQR